MAGSHHPLPFLRDVQGLLIGGNVRTNRHDADNSDIPGAIDPGVHIRKLIKVRVSIKKRHQESRSFRILR